MLEKWKRDGGPFSSYICEKAESVWKEIEFGIRDTVEVIPYFVSVWIITTLHKKFKTWLVVVLSAGKTIFTIGNPP